MSNIAPAPKPTTEDRAHNLFNRVMESAPMGLLVCAALGLSIVGVFQFIFYFSVLPGGWNFTLITVLSAALACFFEALGFYFLVTTVRDFSGGARKEGWIGLAATFLLWAYALWECRHIAERFSAHTPENYWSIVGLLGTITCIVRVVEFRIALTVTSAVQRKNQLAEMAEKLTAEQKALSEATAQLSAFQSEKAAAENAQRIEAERKTAEDKRRSEREAEQAETARLQRESEMQAEIARLQRRINSGEKIGIQKPQRAAPAEKILQAAVKLTRKNNGVFPAIGAVEAEAGYSEGNARKYFPNGSLQAQVAKLLSEASHEAEFSEN